MGWGRPAATFFPNPHHPNRRRFIAGSSIDFPDAAGHSFCITPRNPAFAATGVFIAPGIIPHLGSRFLLVQTQTPDGGLPVSTGALFGFVGIRRHPGGAGNG